MGGITSQDNLVIKVYPISGRGDLAIQVKLATELWNEQRLESRHSVQLEILTQYQTLADFGKDLKDLAFWNITFLL